MNTVICAALGGCCRMWVDSLRRDQVIWLFFFFFFGTSSPRKRNKEMLTKTAERRLFYQTDWTVITYVFDLISEIKEILFQSGWISVIVILHPVQLALQLSLVRKSGPAQHMGADKTAPLLRLWFKKVHGQACKIGLDAWSNAPWLAPVLWTITLKTMW